MNTLNTPRFWQRKRTPAEIAASIARRKPGTWTRECRACNNLQVQGGGVAFDCGHCGAHDWIEHGREVPA